MLLTQSVLVKLGAGLLVILLLMSSLLGLWNHRITEESFEETVANSGLLTGDPQKSLVGPPDISPPRLHDDLGSGNDQESANDQKSADGKGSASDQGSHKNQGSTNGKESTDDQSTQEKQGPSTDQSLPNDCMVSDVYLSCGDVPIPKQEGNPYTNVTDPQNKYLIFRNWGGFGNQLKALLKAMQFARKYNRILVMPPVFSNHITGHYMRWDKSETGLKVNRKDMRKKCLPSARNIFVPAHYKRYVYWEDVAEDLGMYDSPISCNRAMRLMPLDEYAEANQSEKVLCVEQIFYLNTNFRWRDLDFVLDGPLGECPMGERRQALLAQALRTQDKEGTAGDDNARAQYVIPEQSTCAIHWRVGDFKRYCKETKPREGTCYQSPVDLANRIVQEVGQGRCKGGIYLLTVASCDEKRGLLSELDPMLKKENVHLTIQFQETKTTEKDCTIKRGGTNWENIDVELLCVNPAVRNAEPLSKNQPMTSTVRDGDKDEFEWCSDGIDHSYAELFFDLCQGINADYIFHNQFSTMSRLMKNLRKWDTQDMNLLL
eukprot:Clim_evm6s84 gene=Clim_evmTU6s84